MLLPKTLQSLQNTQKDVIKDTLQDALYSYGVNVALLDVIFGHYFIYALLSDGVLMPVFLHENRISYKQSQAYGLPKVHFCVCNEIAEDFNLANKARTLDSKHYIAKFSNKNAFSVSIKQGLNDVGLYNDYPLDLCPMCSEILKFLREGEAIDSTLQVYVFSHQWLNLLESRPEIRQRELLVLQDSNLFCYKCKKPLTSQTEAWIRINEHILEVCCC
ncbi:hypothetical protein [Helicobacter typhlonius]|uniref:Predicted membrane-associated n=1 Tax=Helicobacter typhlonius TaxID=76936 RepID=A0A099UI80_9HELI|nr:hypothetical protein [Helicobacter typhlonius]TLD79124.1 hypothetical protein LS75_002125 [Helicobacter typhlonius]CUU40443.1 predicted membrane-associated [Helicobacter typhlonius]HCD72682.1 hypothetical protein [Helicobacter sp.]